MCVLVYFSVANIPQGRGGAGETFVLGPEVRTKVLVSPLGSSGGQFECLQFHWSHREVKIVVLVDQL